MHNYSSVNQKFPGPIRYASSGIYIFRATFYGSLWDFYKPSLEMSDISDNFCQRCYFDLIEFIQKNPKVLSKLGTRKLT